MYTDTASDNMEYRNMFWEIFKEASSFVQTLEEPPDFSNPLANPTIISIVGGATKLFIEYVKSNDISSIWKDEDNNMIVDPGVARNMTFEIFKGIIMPQILSMGEEDDVVEVVESATLLAAQIARNYVNVENESNFYTPFEN